MTTWSYCYRCRRYYPAEDMGCECEEWPEVEADDGDAVDAYERGLEPDDDAADRAADDWERYHHGEE